MKKITICTVTVLLFVLSAAAQTKQITIGKFSYVGSSNQTLADGSVIQTSMYDMTLNTVGITAQPITFKDATMIVKGSKANTISPITTGNGCGVNSTFPPCEVGGFGGPSSLGYILPPCAVGVALVQDCISIALQLTSTTGKNFNITLADGTQFCTYAVSNTFVLARQGQTALNPQCNALGFCKGVSAPIVLHAASATSCTG